MRHRLISLALVLLAGPAGAASLRPMTELSAPVVRLSDLFDDAGARASLALGPAPAPGESITVEAPQLGAIARQFGVAWRPASPADRAILSRRGVPLERDAVLAAVRAALDQQDAGDGALDLAGFDPPIVAPEAHARPVVVQLSLDAPSGRFTAALSIEGDGMVARPMRLTGRLEAQEDVIVATHRVPAGTALSADDLATARVRRSALSGGEVARTASQARGLAPRRTLAAGVPIALADLAPPVVVARGDRVAVSLDAPGLTLSSMGEALEPGPVGARVRVLNPSSRAVLMAEVTGPGTVRLEPGSLPLRPGGDAGQAQASGSLPR